MLRRENLEVNIGMENLGDKAHLGRNERILLRYVYGELKHSFLIWSVYRPLQLRTAKKHKRLCKHRPELGKLRPDPYSSSEDTTHSRPRLIGRQIISHNSKKS